MFAKEIPHYHIIKFILIWKVTSRNLENTTHGVNSYGFIFKCLRKDELYSFGFTTVFIITWTSQGLASLYLPGCYLEAQLPNILKQGEPIYRTLREIKFDMYLSLCLKFNIFLNFFQKSSLNEKCFCKIFNAVNSYQISYLILAKSLNFICSYTSVI